VLPLVDQALALRSRPTALFVPADSIAVQVYRALAMRGIAVGQTMSVLSVNHEHPLLDSLFPRLTTIDIHAGEIGRRAVELLFWRLEHPEAAESSLHLTPTLVPGESVAPITER
jgi:LacI family transcriptional regulator